MTRTTRIVGVSLGLVAAGAVAGATATVLGHLAIVAFNGWWRIALDPFLLTAAISHGAKLGAVIGPPVGWLLLRRVPVGVAALGSMAGAMVGGVAAAMLAGPIQRAIWGQIIPGVFPGFWGALAGVVAVALVLRRRFPSRPARTLGASAADAALPLTGPAEHDAFSGSASWPDPHRRARPAGEPATELRR